MKVRHSHGILVDGVVHYISHGHEMKDTGHSHVFRSSGDFRIRHDLYEKWLKGGGLPNEDMRIRG